MALLIFNLFLILFEGVFVYKNAKKLRKVYCIIAFLQLFILHAFLDPYKMHDLPGYINTFELFGANSLKYSIVIGYSGVKMELGWILFCKILYIISHNYEILLISTSIIIVGAYCLSIYKYSPIVWLSVFIFLCTLYCQSLFVLRQHMAMALCLLTIPYITEQKWKQFLLIYLIAISIHTSAIIFGIVYVVYNININKRFWLWAIIITFVTSVISASVFSWLFSHTWYDSYGEKEGSNFTMFFISLCTLLLYLYSIKWKTSHILSYEKCFLIMGIIAVSCSMIGAGFSPTNRLVKYFTISTIFLIPQGIYRLKDVKLKLGFSILVVFFFSLLFFSKNNITYIENYSLII